MIDLLKNNLHSWWVKVALDLEEAKTYPFTLVNVEGTPLVTSDTPCFTEDEMNFLQLERDEGPGRAFICPLTPRLAFVGARGIKAGYTKKGNDWARLINARMRANAKKSLIANTDNLNEGWFLTDSRFPPTMRGQIDQLPIKRQPKGFG